MNPRACRVCGNTEGNASHLAREMAQGRRDPFEYLECGACGCLQIVAVPPNLADYYGGSYYSLLSDLDAEFGSEDTRRSTGERVRALLTAPEAEAAGIAHTDMRRPLWSLRGASLRTDSRILDVGSGAGRLVYLLRLAGWSEVLGIDPLLRHDLAYAYGPEVLRRELHEVAGGWDMIMFHHAFEHLAEPLAVLRQVRERLAPGGVCLLRLPLADSEAWRRYGVDWVQLDAPRHLFLHTRRSLAVLAEQAGFSLRGIAHDSYELQFWGSEQYRRDIPLRSPKSYNWGQGAPLFSAEQLAAWREESARLNREGRGDQGAVYLEAAA